MSPTGRWRAAFMTALVVQCVVLYVPRAPSTGGVPLLDKLVHALVFGAVAFPALRSGFAMRWVVGVLLVHAAASELLQSAVLPDRSGDMLDVVADCAGVALGIMLAVNTRQRAWLRR